MPQRPKEHLNDKLATSKLKEVFPNEWMFINPRDVDDGREYCEDLIIKVVEGTNVTGREFIVQNKANAKIRKNHIGVSIEVDCLTYLLDEVVRPVLLHGYHIPTSTGYWIWLEDWELANKNENWKKQKSITIRIPKANQLTILTVDEIKAKVADFYWRFTSRNKIDRFNRRDSDYEASPPVFKGKNIYSVIKPKHDAARPFFVELDEKNSAVLQKTLEEGVANKIRVISTDMPNPFSSESFDTIELELIPLVKDVQTLCKLSYESADDEIIFDDNIQLKLIQHGSQILKWSAQLSSYPYIQLFLEVNLKTRKTNLNLSLDQDDRSVVHIHYFLALMEKLSSVSTIELMNLMDSRVLFRETNVHFDYDRPEDGLLQLIEHLAFISEKSEIELYLPTGDIEEKDIVNIAYVAEIIRQGTSKNYTFIENLYDTDNLVVQGLQKASEIAELYSKFEHDREVYIRYEKGNEVSVKLLNQTIQLGMAFQVFHTKEILNIVELEKSLESSSSDELVEVIFALNSSECFLEFAKWPV